MRKILAGIALIVFCVSLIISLRQPISSVFLVAVAIIPIHYSGFIGKNVALITVIVGCVGVLFYVNSMVPLWGDRYQLKVEQELRSDIAKERRYQELNKISASKHSVDSVLKDPDSAKYTGNYVSNNGHVCGLVNAKNSFGAYTGYTRYFTNNAITVVDDGSNEFSILWRDNCSK